MMIMVMITTMVMVWSEITGFVAENQTLNAPITDFEVHFLSDCEEEYDEEEDQMIQPDLSACTNEFSIPLTGGEAEGVTITYTDHDGDGLVSPGDEMSVEWGDYDGEEIDKMEIYDTYGRPSIHLNQPLCHLYCPGLVHYLELYVF